MTAATIEALIVTIQNGTWNQRASSTFPGIRHAFSRRGTRLQCKEFLHAKRSEECASPNIAGERSTADREGYGTPRRHGQQARSDQRIAGLLPR
jgi:hypothetical protein